MDNLILLCVLAVFGYALIKVKKIPVFKKNQKKIGIQDKQRKEIMTRTYKFEMGDFVNPLEFDKLIYDCIKAESVNDNIIVKDFKTLMYNDWLYLTIIYSLTD